LLPWPQWILSKYLLQEQFGLFSDLSSPTVYSALDTRRRKISTLYYLLVSRLNIIPLAIRLTSFLLVALVRLTAPAMPTPAKLLSSAVDKVAERGTADDQFCCDAGCDSCTNTPCPELGSRQACLDSLSINKGS
jgi:hypothetical protein